MLKIIYIIVFSSQLSATWLENIPQKVIQSNGLELELLASGDQYAHRLHDKAGFTIVLNPSDGDFYYAQKRHGEIIPSVYKVGLVDPKLIGLSPGLNISKNKYLEKKEYYEQSMSNRNGRDAPTSGNLAQLNVFIKFADDPNFPFSRDYYDIPFNSNTEASIKDYYYEVSYGTLTVDTYHYPPSILGSNTSYTDSRNRGYYSPYSATNTEGYQTEDERTAREHSLLRDAVVGIQNSVPEDLNIDVNNDGYVDALSFSINGNVDGWSELLWPHRWALFSYDIYINGARVYDYTFELTESSYFTAGVLCHEFFHVLGAPDLYHYDGGGAPDAVGGWDIMESTSNPPQYMGAFLKWKYGDWLPEIPEINSSGRYSLNPLQQQENVAFKIASPNSETEYYVIEYRVKEGRYDSNTPGSRDGLLVYRINTEAGNGNAQGPPDEIYLYRPGGTLTSQGSFVSAPYNASWSHTEINDFSNPEPYLYNNGFGASGGLNLLNVGTAGETISFTVSMGSPTIELNQNSVVFNMEPNEFQSQNITLLNGGDTETLLMFELNSANLPFANPVGGPDEGGYYWSSSSSDSSLDFSWIDIEGLGTQIQFANNDDSPNPVSIGFNFPFFDSEYSEVLINPNGWIGFGQDSPSWSNISIPNVDAPKPAIMAMWDDLNPINDNGNTSAAGNVSYYTDVENDYFVIWYDNVVTWQNNTVLGEFDFQVVLHQDGSFELNYNEIIGSSSSATVGFQDENGTNGTLLSLNEDILTSQQSIFVSKASQSEWLTIGTQSGEMSGLLAGGQPFNINLMVNTNGMEIGSYYSSLTISSDQVDSQTLPIELELSGEVTSITLPFIDITEDTLGIVTLPDYVDSRISAVFEKYTHLELAENVVIPILAQEEVTTNQILHVKKILKEFLTDVPGSDWGENKIAIINAVSMSNAFLALLNDESEYENPDVQFLFDSGAKGQDILGTEIFHEGTNAYMNSSSRDATYEEVLHFVHNYGIVNTLPSMQLAIDQAMNSAVSNGIYVPLPDVPIEDQDDEYFALVMEVYFGLWAHDPEQNGWAGGLEYHFTNRQQMSDGDSLGAQIARDFFGQSLRYMAELPYDFEGLFSMSFNPSLDYTNRSRYLQNVKVLGENDVDIIGNDLRNIVFGNSGSNHFTGKGLDDYFDGSEGIDRIIFSGDYGEYAIFESADWNDYKPFVVDLFFNRDGADTLLRVEEMDFNGIIYSLEGQLSSSSDQFIIDEFRLFPSYPNPFNSSTSIKFNLPKESSINLVVIDLLGRNVRTILDNEIRNMGSYQVKWHGYDDYGSLVPSGIYLIHFTSDAYSKHFKTVLLK
jgi:M6 family metalloprotease-like protein